MFFHSFTFILHAYRQNFRAEMLQKTMKKKEKKIPFLIWVVYLRKEPKLLVYKLLLSFFKINKFPHIS